METRTALFIGVPSQHECMLLDTLQPGYVVHTILESALVYQQLAHTIPHVLVFGADQMSTQALRLFRQLRRLTRVWVIICDGSDLYAFVGRNHRYRQCVPNTAVGLSILLRWAEQTVQEDKVLRSTAVPSLPQGPRIVSRVQPETKQIAIAMLTNWARIGVVRLRS